MERVKSKILENEKNPEKKAFIEAIFCEYYDQEKSIYYIAKKHKKAYSSIYYLLKK